jgi:WD40 repeat protein
LIGHSAKITKVAFDVDDKIVSSSFDNTVILWDFKSMDVISTFDQSMGAVTDLLLTPNYIIASSLDYTAFCVDYQPKKKYPFNLEAPDYDLDS